MRGRNILRTGVVVTRSLEGNGLLRGLGVGGGKLILCIIFFDCGRSIELSTQQEMHGKTEPCPAELNDGGEWRLVHWGRELRLAVSAPEWYYHAAIFIADLHEATS